MKTVRDWQRIPMKRATAVAKEKYTELSFFRAFKKPPLVLGDVKLVDASHWLSGNHLSDNENGERDDDE